MAAGFHGDADAHAQLDGIAGLCRLLEQRGEIRVAADRHQMHAPAVDGHLELGGIFETAHDVQIRSIQPGLEHVVAVERKIVADQQAADGSQRQAIDVLMLREVLAHAVRLASCLEIRIADREGADLARRRDVALL